MSSIQEKSPLRSTGLLRRRQLASCIVTCRRPRERANADSWMRFRGLILLALDHYFLSMCVCVCVCCFLLLFVMMTTKEINVVRTTFSSTHDYIFICTSREKEKFETLTRHAYKKTFFGYLLLRSVAICSACVEMVRLTSFKMHIDIVSYRYANKHV